jgi:hypothetical protein
MSVLQVEKHIMIGTMLIVYNETQDVGVRKIQ